MGGTYGGTENLATLSTLSEFWPTTFSRRKSWTPSSVNSQIRHQRRTARMPPWSSRGAGSRNRLHVSAENHFTATRCAADTVCFVWLLAAGIWNWYLKGHWFALEQFSTTSLPLWQEEIRSLLGDLAAQTVESTNTEVQSVEWVGVQTWNWFVFFLDCITPEVEDEWPERVRLWWMG